MVNVNRITLEGITEVRNAADFADSGSGTEADPWISGIQEAYDDIISEQSEQTKIYGNIFLPPGKFTTTSKMTFDSQNNTYLSIIGSGLQSSRIRNESAHSFNFAEFNETHTNCRLELCNFMLYTKTTGKVLEFHNTTELYMRNVEICDDESHSGLLIFNPSLQSTSYHRIVDSFIIRGKDETVPLVHFTKPSTYNSGELTFQNCIFEPPMDPVNYDRGKVIEIDADAVQRFNMFGNKLYASAGSYPVINIEGNIGASIIDGLSCPICAYNPDASRSRLINFANLASANDAPIVIRNVITYLHSTPYPLKYGVWIGDKWDNISVVNNNFSEVSVEKVHVEPGANVHGEISHNMGD